MKLVVGNLKMYMNLPEVVKYVESMDEINSEQVVICPSNIHISYFLKRGFQVGIQNIFYEEKGAYTGEVSPTQAYELGVKYVILGHSERRKIFKETNEIINQKIKTSLKNNLTVILCVGEDIDEDQSFVIKQLDECLKEIDDYTNIIVAYEPIKAIGTGQVMDSSSINQMVNLIKQRKIKQVLYGGSVDKENVITLKQYTDGFLVGSKATNPLEFKEIIKIVLDDKI